LILLQASQDVENRTGYVRWAKVQSVRNKNRVRKSLENGTCLADRQDIVDIQTLE
jgi:hypothetical protein